MSAEMGQDQEQHVSDLHAQLTEAATRWVLMYPFASWGFWGCAGPDAREQLAAIAEGIAAGWGKTIADAMLAVVQPEIDGLKALTQTCICDPHPATTDGPQADCPVHGAIRGLNEARAEIERLTDQIRTIRTLQAMYATLGLLGIPDQRDVFAQVAKDLGKVLDKPDDQSRET